MEKWRNKSSRFNRTVLLVVHIPSLSVNYHGGETLRNWLNKTQHSKHVGIRVVNLDSDTQHDQKIVRRWDGYSSQYKPL